MYRDVANKYVFCSSSCSAYAPHVRSNCSAYATHCSAYAPHVRYSWIAYAAHWAAYALQEFKRAFILRVEGRTAKQELTFCLSQMSLSAPTQPAAS